MSDAYIPTNLPQRANIQGLWHLDENAVGGIPAFDYSGNGNHLSDVNTTTANSSGKIGYCRDFEESNSEYLYITDGNQTGLNITGEITLACWIKFETLPSTAGGAMTFIGKYNTTGDNRSYYILQDDDDNKVKFRLSSDGTLGNSTLASSNTALSSTGTWYHVAATLNQTTDKMQTYINGSADGSEVSYTSNIADKTASFRLGAYDNGVYMDGLIDEVIVWNTALTDSEVSTVYDITEYKYGGVVNAGIGSPWIFMRETLDKGKKYFKKKGLYLPDDRLFKPELVI